MRSIDALEPLEKTDTSKEIIINEDTTSNAIGELSVNLKEMTESTKDSIEKITTDFQICMDYLYFPYIHQVLLDLLLKVSCHLIVFYVLL